MRVFILTLMIGTLNLSCTGETPSVDFPELPEISTSKQTQTNLHESDVVKQWQIALMGEIRGELEPCGCPTLPYGGFSRRQNALESLNTEMPLFQLDAGELLLKGFFSNKDASSKERALLLGELSKDVGVDAWTVGPSDLMAVGLDALKDMTGPTRISATWVDDKDDYLFPPYTILSKSNVDLAVIGLSTKPTDPQWQIINTLSATEALERVLPTIPTSVDMIIALGSMDDEEIDSIKSTFPEIQLYLTTEGASYDDPQLGSGTPIVEAPKQGRFIQMIHVRHNTTARSMPIQGLTETEWRQWLTLPKDTQTHPLHSKIQAVGQGQVLLHTELIPLSGIYDSQEARVQDKISAFASERIEISQNVAEQPTTQTEPGYAASGRCAQCHSTEMAKWSFSKHARAWESLIAHPTEGSTSNPECIGCHTTGFGQVGGFGEPSIANIRKFKAVQCEACHGPMKGHPQDDSIQSIPISEETCLSCHDKANSPNFQYEDYLHRATCQSK